MRNFFLEGGVGMFPTLFFGAAALLLAGWYALKPKAQTLPLIIGLGAASLLAGMLGTVMGFKATVSAVVHEGPDAFPADKLPMITLAGLSESSNNLLLALGLTILVALALGVGGYRARQPSSVAA